MISEIGWSASPGPAPDHAHPSAPAPTPTLSSAQLGASFPTRPHLSPATAPLRPLTPSSLPFEVLAPPILATNSHQDGFPPSKERSVALRDRHPPPPRLEFATRAPPPPTSGEQHPATPMWESGWIELVPGLPGWSGCPRSFTLSRVRAASGAVPYHWVPPI